MVKLDIAEDIRAFYGEQSEMLNVGIVGLTEAAGRCTYSLVFECPKPKMRRPNLRFTNFCPEA
jgi:hypothetical protein